MDNQEIQNQELKFEKRKVSELIPYARNSRTHSDEQVAQIAASIKEFGFMAPIIVSKDNTIIAGHGRILAARKLGLEIVPCLMAEHLTEAQIKAYVIADNKLSENAGWDNEMLKVEIEDLKGLDFDIDILGFDEKELNSLFEIPTEAKEDDFDVEEQLKKPVFSQAGDIWQLGKHRVICGDSTFEGTYKQLLGDKKVNLVLTDPPYFVALESASGKIKNDDLNDMDAVKFLMSVFANFNEYMANDASIYVFYATMKARVFYDAFEDSGFKVGAGLIWKKPRAPFMRTDWKFNMEPLIFGWKKQGKHIWYGDQKQKAVFEFDGIKNSKEDGFGHPSSKPVPLLAYLLGLSTQTNGLVLDGFLGSASTLIACEQLNRVCYGVELEPKFVDVAVERYKKFKEGNTSDITVIRGGKEMKYEEVFKNEQV